VRGTPWKSITAILLGFLALLMLPGGALAAEPGLVGQWHFDGYTGSGVNATTPDSSGFGGTGSFANTPTLTPGRFGSAFNGPVGAEPMTVSGTSGNGSWALEPAGAVSLTAWVKYTGDPGVLKYIASKGDFRYVPNGSDCAGGSYALYTGYNGRPGLTFYVTTPDGNSRSSPNLTDNSKVFDGQWHAVTGTYDGSNARLYVDGVLVPGAQGGAGSGAIRYGGSLQQHSAFGVGAYPDAGTCPDNSKFPGSIDEVRVHNRALTAGEITKLHDPAATTPPDLTPPGQPTLPPSPSLVAAPSPDRRGVLFDASATRNASSLLLNLGNGHQPAMNIPASEPYVRVTIPQGSGQAVSLTATGPGGQRSGSFLRPAFAGIAGPKSLVAQLPQVAVASASRAVFLDTNIFCAPTDLAFALIGAHGCFTQATSPSQVPVSEQASANQYWSSYLGNRVYELACVKNPHPPSADSCAAFKAGVDKEYSVWLSKGSIKLNGMTLSPRSGATIVVDPLDMRVFSSNATLKLGKFLIKQGNVDLDFKDMIHHTGKASPTAQLTYTGFTQPLLTFDARKDVPVIGGFPLNAGAELRFASDNGVRKSEATLHVVLPQVFDAFGSGDQPSAAATVSATNDRDFFIDTLDIKVPHASIGGIGLDNVAFHYADGGDPRPEVNCPRKYWQATADIHLGSGPNGEPGAGISMTPPPALNGVAFCAGSFKSAGAVLHFGYPIPPPELFPGVLLDDINFGISLNPTLLRGGATISAVEISKISGELLAVFARPWEPYTLTAADAGVALQDLAGRRFTSTSFAIGGAIAMHVPGVGDLNIAHGGAVYSYPDYIGVAAQVDTQLGIFVFHGGLSGQFNLGRRLFELDANAHICVRGFAIACGGGLLVASERGVVACVQLGPLNPGVGVKFNGSVDVWIPDGCKPSHYWSAGRGSFAPDRAGAAAAATTISVARGEHSKSIKLVGSGGAPRVVVTGPHGQTLTVPGNGAFSHGALQAISASTYSTTWLGIKNGPPGRYKITLLAGSAPVRSVSATRPAYDTNFTARVSGHGKRLTLRYDARRRGGGQRVTFFEKAAGIMHPLVTSTGGTGKVTFTPATGAGGTRTIVASATVDGARIGSQTLTRFHVARLGKTGRPSKVTVRRRGSTLLIGWTSVAGATRYGVLVNLSDGSQRRYELRASKRSLRLGNFPLTAGGRVSVSARGVLGDWGRARRSSAFRALRAPASVLLTKKIRHRHR
jgi:hypothetical protein